MFNLIPFPNKTMVITEDYDFVDLTITAAFEFEDKKYAVIEGGKGFVEKGQYTILEIIPIHDSDKYENRLVSMSEDKFYELVQKWEWHLETTR